MDVLDLDFDFSDFQDVNIPPDLHRHQIDDEDFGLSLSTDLENNLLLAQSPEKDTNLESQGSIAMSSPPFYGNDSTAAFSGSNDSKPLLQKRTAASDLEGREPASSKRPKLQLYNEWPTTGMVHIEKGEHVCQYCDHDAKGGASALRKVR